MSNRVSESLLALGLVFTSACASLKNPIEIVPPVAVKSTTTPTGDVVIDFAEPWRLRVGNYYGQREEPQPANPVELQRRNYPVNNLGAPKEWFRFEFKPKEKEKAQPVIHRRRTPDPAMPQP